MSESEGKRTGLPLHIYRMTIDLIRGYPEMKRKLLDLVEVGVVADGQPKGTNTSDPTFEAVQRRWLASEGVDAIDKALLSIPEEYRETVLEWAITRAPLPTIHGSMYADRNTWSKYREILYKETATNMGWYEEWRQM